MAYTVPPRWAHGDRTASAANMNKYSDGLNAVYDSTASVHLAVGKFELPPTPSILVEPVEFLHVWRWLWYMSITGETATIVDPSGVNADVSLPDNDTTMTVYDLAEVSWLVPGQVYRMTGCQYACEDWSA